MNKSLANNGLILNPMMRKMKNIINFGSILVILLLCQSNALLAQKFGYVDTDYVLSQMSEYKEANAEIAKLSKAWEAEIQEMYKEIQALETSLKAEEVLLTKEMKDDRYKEIDRKWNEVKEYQNKIFGFEGLFFLKKKELIKPVQDKVFESVEKVAKVHRLQIVFDKSGDLVMIYTDPVHDYTDYVLEELGLGDKNDVISNN
ncbi:MULTISPECIES: OmpH family outer membrane protein [Reichenbachiella]|uniref:Periplasmic chaperone for outer membrane proteins Skp n=1 Tax=Reichenbachiella agariperforans TaxID=156994 RepID=A0A1M6TVF2_REIAG|nr:MULTISPECIES: OmpH family outer membrane protein [Reichenbachiella]SHK61025.1 periplasmic chaperone for outer membrane proteins Skp [Reichenbachiella agariperforans]